MDRYTKLYLQAILTIVALVGPAFGQTVIYVDNDAPAGGNGESWNTAYKCLQDALEEVKSQLGDITGRPGSGRSLDAIFTLSLDSETNSKSVEIRIAQGVYTPDQGANQTPDDRMASFELLSYVSLKGGYAGLGMPDPNARDIELYATVLSGDLAGNDVEVNDPSNLEKEPTRSENSINIVLIMSASDIQLEGLTISGGFGNISKRNEVATTTLGAGVYAIDCSELLIQKCRFINNFTG